MRQAPKRRSIFFITLLFAITVVVNLSAARAGSPLVSSLLIMWSPAPANCLRCEEARRLTAACSRRPSAAADAWR